MKEISEQSRPTVIFIFIFVVIVCSVIPGLIVAKVLFPELIEGGLKGVVTIGLIVASPAVLPAFIIISVWGYIRRGAGGLVRFMADFTYAGFTCFLSYLPAIALVSLFDLSVLWFTVVSIPLWVLSLWRFMVMPRTE